jgi:hypothetical protein
MKGYVLPIAFALATAFFWGIYGPALSKARGSWSAFKPYVFIGVAYLVWGIIGGLGGMKFFGDSMSFGGNQAPAMKWGFLAGSLGAFGALTLSAAVLNAKGVGGPALVMPIVFGGATLVNAIVELVLAHDKGRINPLLWVGMLLVIAGIVLVRLYTPGGPKKPAAPPVVTETIVPGQAGG